MNQQKTKQLLTRMQSKIVTDKDVKFLVAQGLKVFTPDMLSMMKKFSFDPEKTIRFSFLASRCSERRKELGWDIPTAAGKVGVPRYRIHAIESGHYTEYSQKEVRLYVKVLGINYWFERWRKLNRRAYATIVEEPDRSTPWAKKVRGTNV